VAAESGSFASVKVVAAAFGVILVGELGDLTQLLTLNLAARYHQGLSVFIGAAAALVALAAVGAYGGRALLAVLPLGVLRRVAGVVLLGVGAYSIYALASS
jgi:putative Ca2+/H+ antiporter (TMEM165/GDT1 family)